MSHLKDVVSIAFRGRSERCPEPIRMSEKTIAFLYCTNSPACASSEMCYQAERSHPPDAVLSELHAPVWWGDVLIMLGAVYCVA
jgi:hypothetical protein